VAAAVEAPRAGEAAGAEAPREEAVAAVEGPHEAAEAAAEVPNAEEVAAVVEAARDAEVQRRAAPVAPVVALPSAAAWAFHRDQVLPWPGP
jgi:hypothetical protein